MPIRPVLADSLDAVGVERRIGTDQRNLLDQRLSGQQAIERTLVMPRERSEPAGVPEFDWKDGDVVVAPVAVCQNSSYERFSRYLPTLILMAISQWLAGLMTTVLCESSIVDFATLLSRTSPSTNQRKRCVSSSTVTAYNP